MSTSMLIFDRRFCRYVLFVLVLLAMPFSSGRAVTEHEQLLVFLQPGVSEVDEVFQREQLPGIRAIAETMGVSFHLIDGRRGAPEAVALTPLIVYQNHRGRSIYQGRTTTPGRIRNFIRTSRFVPQGEAPNRRKDIPVWQLGRERVWAPLKVSSLTGSRPDDYDDADFRAEALAGIARGFRHFRMQPEAALGRADRGFYMDFYPWRGDDGTLFLSIAVYSQFHCKAPIYEKKQEPLTGPWKNRQAMFAKAAALAEAAVVTQIGRPQSGDAFDPLADTVPLKTWNELGYVLPPAPPKAALTDASVALTPEWVLAASGPDDPPMIQFRFPAPLDNYAGEVKAAAGALTLPTSLALDGAQGAITVDTRTAITMGEPVLDEAILGSALLSARKFPTAAFRVDTIQSDQRPIAYGRLAPAVIKGHFDLKGTRRPLEAVAEVEPVIDADGQPRLLMRASFRIDLRNFDVEGADGPEPARYIVIFDTHFKLKPKSAV